jgi:lipid-A-disaccharide synthase
VSSNLRTPVSESDRYRIFLSVGEASGDHIGAALVQEMKRLSGPGASVGWDSLDVVELVMQFEDEFDISIADEEIAPIKDWDDVTRFLQRKGVSPDRIAELAPGPSDAPQIQFQGVTGPRLRAEDVKSVVDSSRWGVVGIAQALRVAPVVYAGLQKAKAALSSGKPGLFVAIDFGFFNVKLARFAREKGWKVLYFMPPGSWRRDKQGGDLPAVANEIVTPFPWSAELLRGMGASAHWFGHPLKQIISSSELGARNSELIGVLPGSRRHELELNLPLIADALKGVDRVAEFALAPSLDEGEVRVMWDRLAPGRSDRFTSGDTYGVLSRAHAAIVCSGTATLEAALLGCPMVVIYRLSAGMKFQAKVAGFKPEYVSLPNILLQRTAVPEAVGDGATAARVREVLLPLLAEGPEREAQLSAFAEIQELTGDVDAITRTAELALKIMDS